MRRAGKGLNRFSEKASLSSYSLTSSLRLVRIGLLQWSSAARTSRPVLMALRNHSKAESGVGLCDLLVMWTQARASRRRVNPGVLLLRRKKWCGNTIGIRAEEESERNGLLSLLFRPVASCRSVLPSDRSCLCKPSLTVADGVGLQLDA